MSYRFESRRTEIGFSICIAKERRTDSGVHLTNQILAMISIENKDIEVREDGTKIVHRTPGGIILPTTAQRLDYEHGIRGDAITQHIVELSESIDEYSGLQPTTPALEKEFKVKSKNLLDTLGNVAVNLIEASELSSDEAQMIEQMRQHIVDQIQAPSDDLPGFYL